MLLFVGCACATLVLVLANSHVSQTANITLTEVEAITACESIGWWDNDGNCVNDGKKNYFCKKDSWCELTDCKI